MRGASLCTVSAPLAACNLPPVGAASLPPSARFLALHLLTSTTDSNTTPPSTTQQQTLYFIVEAKSRVKEVYSQTCLHFAQQGMLDTDLFGLALICDGEYLFAEPESKLSKYAPKSWRSSHTHGLDANGRPALAFYFRVQFYVDSPLLLRDEITRHHYYLQVRENAATRTGAAVLAPDHALMLAGLALQADLGDKSNTPGYFRPEDYVPPALRTPWGIQTIETHHNQNRGISRTEAEMQYIQEVCALNEPINAHVFRLRVSKQELHPGSILLAVCAHGVKVYPDNNPVSTFLWGSIGKLSFEKKKFEIRTAHEKLTLFTSCDEKSKLLLALCRYTHQFSMAMAPRLSEVRKELDKRWCLPRSSRPDQRISVISNTSSNTTSGIVSDRVHSEDELEILITCPPALQSTESLALAHLIDSSIEDLKTIDKGRNKGSQCSSSCSTVVTSRAKLSHTPQNSTVSDAATCFEMDVNSQTSGVHTMSVDQPDSVFRDRSNSNLSSVDSFRGDGTDPTETKQILSAQELSNLIVGGKYPSHQTVSHTLDSDSDYVTISSSSCGFPPIPPKRFDSKYSFLDGGIAESVKTRLSDPPPYSARLDNLSWYAFSSPNQSLYDGVGPPPYPYIPKPSTSAAPPPIPPKHPKLYTLLPPPPPPQVPRQPPPPPPPGIATVYTKQLSQSQIDQYQQQMHSDVDFVIFPLKEPSLSKQEYFDSKHLTQYRSTPYLNIPLQKSTKYASTHNLTEPRRYTQIPPRPPRNKLSKSTEVISAEPNKSTEVIDIRTLREKSKNLDLPLISALCNDRSLLKQTKAFVMPKHPDSSSPKVPSLSSTAKLKYPVSGFNNSQLSKKLTTKGTSHRHPSDKLPDIPRAAPNQYVTNERQMSAKHKAIRSQLSQFGT